MKTRDLVIAPTNSAWTTVNSLVESDTDQNDISAKWKNATITNNSDVSIYVKSTNKTDISASSDVGRIIPAGDSFNYLELDTRELWILGDAGATGVVVFSFNQE